MGIIRKYWRETLIGVLVMALAAQTVFVDRSLEALNRVPMAPRLHALSIVSPGENVQADIRQNMVGHVGSTFVTGARVPASSTDTQDEATLATIDNYSLKTNGVALWGQGVSRAPGARIWGGFFSVYNQVHADAQEVGVEVDTINRALPGVYPNKAKDGIQVVGIGSAANTNALEILGDGTGNWTNGIVFDASSVTPTGTLIGEAGKGPYKLGLDFGNATFTDAAIQVGPGQHIRLNTAHGAAVLYTRGNRLVIQAPSGGIEFDNAQGKQVSYIP